MRIMEAPSAANGVSESAHNSEVSQRTAGRAGPSHSDDEDDEIIEHDPSGRYSRYKHAIGTGRFKHVYKGFDEKQGIDIAWSKIDADSNHLSSGQMHKIVEEMGQGINLDHPHIIKCYKCWEDESGINLITEYFTSGNLRDYRQRHKHLGMKAVKKWGRQILLGLDHLHQRDPPMVHGDLRCDKIYINGHTGEIKIGDLGLATLLIKRYQNGNYNGEIPSLSCPADIFSFGLCLLELVTLKKLDLSNCEIFPELLRTVTDETARHVISLCLGPAYERPTAPQLMENPFFSRKAVDGDEKREPRRTSNTDVMDDPLTPSCEVGVVRGEDYTFHFSGKIKDNTLHFRLNMQYEGDEGEEAEIGKRTIDFVYDPDVDTPENIAQEIAAAFNLSSTDTDICAAALKEWLARNAPDPS